MFVFVDEMGCDKRGRYRRYAYGLKGKGPIKQCNLFRGEHISAIVAMTNEMVLDFNIPYSWLFSDISKGPAFSKINSQVRLFFENKFP